MLAEARKHEEGTSSAQLSRKGHSFWNQDLCKYSQPVQKNPHLPDEKIIPYFQKLVKSPRETNPEHISSNAFKITSVNSSIKELILWSVNAFLIQGSSFPYLLLSFIFIGKVLQTK